MTHCPRSSRQLPKGSASPAPRSRRWPAGPSGASPPCTAATGARRRSCGAWPATTSGRGRGRCCPRRRRSAPAHTRPLSVMRFAPGDGPAARAPTPRSSVWAESSGRVAFGQGQPQTIAGWRGRRYCRGVERRSRRAAWSPASPSREQGSDLSPPFEIRLPGTAEAPVAAMRRWRAPQETGPRGVPLQVGGEVHHAGEPPRRGGDDPLRRPARRRRGTTFLSRGQGWGRPLNRQR